MAVDVRHLKGGQVSVTAYANIAAALTAVVDAGTGARVDMFPTGDGFVYLDMGRGFLDVYLTDSQGTGTGTVYQVHLVPDIP